MWASFFWARLCVTTLWTIGREFDGRLLLITRKTSPKKMPQELPSHKLHTPKWFDTQFLYIVHMYHEDWTGHKLKLWWTYLCDAISHNLSYPFTSFFPSYNILFMGEMGHEVRSLSKIHLANISVISLRILLHLVISFLVQNSSHSHKFGNTGMRVFHSSSQNQFYVVTKEVKSNIFKCGS